MITSKHSKLTEQVLPHLNIAAKGLKISRIFVGQLGHIVLSPKEFVKYDSSITDIMELIELQEKYDYVYDFDSLSGDYITALREDPHIFGLSKDTEAKAYSGSCLYYRYSIDFEEALFFTIKVPSTKKHFEIYEDDIEQFNVLSLGSPYVAFTEIDDCPRHVYVAHEFREQMREMLAEHATEFNLGQVGPSPIHPYIYVLDVEDENIDKLNIFSHDKDLYVFVNTNKHGIAIKDVFEMILYEFAVKLNDFFYLGKSRSYIRDLREAVSENLRSLVQEYRAMHLNPLFIPFKKIALLRKDLLTIHMATITMESAIISYERERKEFLQRLETSKFFSLLKDYFAQTSTLDVEMTPAFFRTMEYMEKSISSLDVAMRTIFAAIIGAGIGMLVTILLK